LQVFGIPGALNGDLPSGSIDLPEIAWREFDIHRCDILLQPVPLRRARDWDN
jgi:hypothetical protein